ncbi:hypothetical protein LMG19083_04717 [Ralstonia psammae]|uniref:Uncharacterized protein n=1 Tax=Ralstonia psammae TaxID=3058598 RepID=A0ABM9JZF5_9RALS|nr:hypothetical protein LMG19083_04717 [Ralstonia sp. LMG 19083]
MGALPDPNRVGFARFCLATRSYFTYARTRRTSRMEATWIPVLAAIRIIGI